MNTSVQAVRGYELRGRIGAGGFGAVYRAFQPSVGREVAVKVILPQFASQPDFIRRFELEAQLVARLEHPHIVPLYDYWREPEGAYLVMRWLRGGNLGQSLEEGPWELARAGRLLDQLTSALSLAHRQGVVHRDVKPSNVLLDEQGNAYLSDFGIAKLLVWPSDLTAEGALVGSPAYISPEQARSEPVTSQSDLYSLGVVLYQVLAGEHPFAGLTPTNQLLKHLSDPLPSLLEKRPELPEALDAVIQRATAKEPDQRYPDVLSFAAAFRQAASPVVEAIAPTPVAPPETVNPYKGLRPFEEADAADFFGREVLTAQLIERLGEEGEASRFLAVVGPSGSGKSSVVKAGLIPALRQGALAGSEKWFVVEMLPGTRPLDELEIGLLQIAVRQPGAGELVEQLRRDAHGLLRAARLVLPEDGELLLIVDQFEELFTRTVDPEESRHLLQSLYEAAMDRRSRVRVVITLRADFYDRPLMHPDFSRLMRRRTEVVVPLTAEEMSDAIRRPAQRVGVEPEPGLVEAIVADVREQPGALPMLQYALTELFERRADDRLTRQAYSEIGGVSGALARRAEEVYGELDEAGQEAARQLFLRLVTLGEGVEDTRRRVLRSELEALGDPSRDLAPVSRAGQGGGSIATVLDLFGRHRLLLFDRDPATREPTVEVAHEALLREWGSLRTWLDESRADVRLQRLLGTAAQEWEGAGQDPSYLLRGTRLAQFEGWAESSTVALTQAEKAYLEASLDERGRRETAEKERRQRELETALQLAETEKARAEAERRRAEEQQRRAEAEKQRAEEQARAARRLRRGALVLAGVLLIAIVLAVIAFLAQQQAARNQQLAEEQRRIAVSRELAATALNNLQSDPELSVLLALEAIAQAETVEAATALHRTVPALHLLRTLSGYSSTLCGLVVAPAGAGVPDGARLVTTSMRGELKIWEWASGREVLAQSIGEEHLPDYIALSPDGTRLATAGWDGTVRVWLLPTDESASLQELFTLPVYSDKVNDVAFSPDGTRLATASGDAAKVWDASTGEQLLTLSGHADAESVTMANLKGVSRVVFGPEGTRLVTAGADGTVRLWDITAEGGQELLVLPAHSAAIFGLALSPDGTRLATSGEDNLVKVWDLSPGPTQGRHLFTISTFAVDVAFSPDGTRLATGGEGPAYVWDAATGQQLLALFGHSGLLGKVVFSPDGTHLFSTGEDQTVRVWDISPDRELLTLVGPSPLAGCAAYSPDGTRLVSGYGNEVIVWDSVSGQKLLTLAGHTDLVSSGAFSPDGTRLATASWDETVKVWDTTTGQELLTLSGHSDRVWTVVFSPDGRHLATASADGTAKVWDATTGQELLTLQGHTQEVVDIAYSPDGSRLATAGWDRTTKVWDATTGRELLTVVIDDYRVWAVAFSPDGSRLAIGGKAGTVAVWDVSTALALSEDEGLNTGITSGEGQVLFDLVGHTDTVYRIAFSPDGTRLATAGWDGTAKVWDAATGQELLSLSLHTDVTLTSVAFSPEGTRLVTTAFDGTARVYALRLEDLVALARERLTRALTTAECRRYLHVEECPGGP